jgi:hypothetical protein
MVMMVVVMVVMRDRSSGWSCWGRIVSSHVIKNARDGLAGACGDAIHQSSCAGYNACNRILCGSELRRNKTSESETC